MKGFIMKKIAVSLLLALLLAIPSMAQKNEKGDEEQSPEE